MILYKAADLIWATRIKETADAIGLACRPARTAEMLAARLDEGGVSALIVDLSADDGVELLAEADRLCGLRGGRARPRLVAFGPHVRKDLFQAARDAGADEVLTNGSMEHDLPEVLIRLAGRA